MGKIFLFVVSGLLTLSAQANTQSYKYTCYSYFWNGYADEKGTLDLTVDDEVTAQANLNNEDGDLIEQVGGSRNRNYRSRGAIKYAKFEGGLVIEESLLSGGRTLKDGSMGGFARVEGEAEGGFYQYKFVCKAR
jgi:hypothetical protein